LQGDAVLFPIAEQPSCSHDQQSDQQSNQQQQQQQHSLLGFTFPSAGVSEVLSLAGTTFRQVALPGLQQGSASLLMTGLPGGWLLQVGPGGVCVCVCGGGCCTCGGAAAAYQDEDDADTFHCCGKLCQAPQYCRRMICNCWCT
jgi:hypothetical protein